MLAVNLEDGNRLVGNFVPNQTLWTVLEQLCPDCLSSEKNPVVVYMRQEIYGQNLQTATLRSLGITGGRAMIRLIDKNPEELKVQANIATPLPHKPVEEKPYIRKLKESDQDTSTPLECKEPDFKNKNSDNFENSNATKSEYIDKDSNKFKKGGTIDLIKLAKEKRKSTDFSTNQEKKPNISNEVGYTEDIKPINPSAITTSGILCDCKNNDQMEVDCCGECESSCINPTENNMDDQFIFVSIF